MAKRRTNPGRGDRPPRTRLLVEALKLAEALRTGSATVAELSEAFDLSPRKVYRIIDDLAEAGYPVRIEKAASSAGRGRPGRRYRLVSPTDATTQEAG